MVSRRWYRQTDFSMKNFLVLILCCLRIECRNLTRCDLVVELLKQGFPEEQLRDWVCLVEAESSRMTHAIGGPDDDGSYDYGLFQVNDRYWCSTGDTPGKGCHVRCQDLLKDDITQASECTKKIYSIQGFEAWLGWVNECHKKQLPDLRSCISNIRTLL